MSAEGKPWNCSKRAFGPRGLLVSLGQARQNVTQSFEENVFDALQPDFVISHFSLRRFFFTASRRAGARALVFATIESARSPCFEDGSVVVEKSDRSFHCGQIGVIEFASVASSSEKNAHTPR